MSNDNPPGPPPAVAPALADYARALLRWHLETTPARSLAMMLGKGLTPTEAFHRAAYAFGSVVGFAQALGVIAGDEVLPLVTQFTVNLQRASREIAPAGAQRRAH